MANLQKSSKIIHITLWVAQVTLAALFITGAVMKFQPIETISAMMPWTGQVPAWIVRLLGLIDLLAAVGLILPSLLRIKPQLTTWTALGIIALMFSAIIFHVSRGEASVIGVNIISAIIALFIAWGRLKKAPITAQ
ncbi:DoxX family protein [Dyadobacter diqingensis]|uniref:DoxX family protein n=1 Tax=Dyadobacter diqingensis TaxID=2938121 RepID=UPI0020C31E1B|nr:DoxX family protein [Dyadobacter diqingensis]